MLFTFHPALLVRMAPVRIHTGGGVLRDVIPEGLILEGLTLGVDLEEAKSHMSVVQQVDLKAEDVDNLALPVRRDRVIHLADH
jgi:hypothetical protein